MNLELARNWFSSPVKMSRASKNVHLVHRDKMGILEEELERETLE